MATARYLRILVIDDDEVMTELLATVLGIEGHTITTASSGEAALTLLSGQAFDLVLTDLQLPGLRGHALAAALRSALSASNASSRLLGMSGSPPSGHELSAFDAFLLKPFTAEQFTAAAAGASSIPPSQPLALDPGSPASLLAGVVGPRPSVLDETVVARLAQQLPAARLKELFELTLSDARLRLDLIQKAQVANDLNTVRREAHAVKGGAGMVGASELHRLAEQLERAAAAGSVTDTASLEDFLAACVRLERMLETRFN
jgi:CheY-like chemotaxis protein